MVLAAVPTRTTITVIIIITTTTIIVTMYYSQLRTGRSHTTRPQMLGPGRWRSGCTRNPPKYPLIEPLWSLIVGV